MSKIKLMSNCAGLPEAREFQAIVEGVFDQYDQEYKVQLSACHETGKVDVYYTFESGSSDKKFHPLHIAIHNIIVDSEHEFRYMAKYQISKKELEEAEKTLFRDENGDAYRMIVLNPQSKL